MPVTSRFSAKSTIALIAIGFLALFAVVGTTIWLGERGQGYFDEVIAARNTGASAVSLRSAVQTAESSQRGFLVTGNEIYLAPYGTAKILAYRQMEALAQGLAPFKESGAALARLTKLINEKFAEMDQTIDLKRARRDAEANAVFKTNRGKALTDEANVFFSGIIRAAENRLTENVGELNANAIRIRWVSFIAAIIISAVVAGVATAVLRYTRELAAARDEVTAANLSLEQRVRDRTADLARANDEIQHFAYIVTHDLRAPLVNIMGFTSELEASVNSLNALIGKTGGGSDPNDPVAKEARIAQVDLPEAIGFIRSSTKKMDNLINAILKLSREGRRQMRPEPVELGDLITTSAAAIQHQLSEAKGEIKLDLDVPAISTDRLSLEQIFGNLLDNAVKYRSGERPLRISIRARIEARNRIVIEVADNGRGIDRRDLERVFELFRRAGTQDQPGEGIGLAQVRTVVRNLGGDITVTSTLDQGTTFRIDLPLHLQTNGSAA
jgi:signal transduction histidine kinase